MLVHGQGYEWMDSFYVYGLCSDDVASEELSSPIVAWAERFTMWIRVRHASPGRQSIGTSCRDSTIISTLHT